MNKHNIPINYTYGSRFAEEHEIMAVGTEIQYDGHRTYAGGVPLLSDGTTTYVDNQDEHTLTIGATGSKKSRNVIRPLIIMLALNGESFIVIDPKGELYKHSNPLLEKLGYNTKVLNFRDSGKGIRWNPMSLAYEHYENGNIDKATEYIRDVASCIYSDLRETTDDVFWANMAEDYFVGLALLLLEETDKSGFTIENIRITHSLGDEKNGMSNRYINDYCKLADEFSDTNMHLSGTINAPNDTRSSIHSVFSQPLSLYLQDNLRDMLCESDIDFTQIGMEGKNAVFLIIPDERSAYNPLITTFIKQCYGCLVDAAHSEGGESLPIRVNFICDEFSSLPEIPDFNNMIAAARSRNIRFHLAVQNLSQLHKKYTKEIAQTILANCAVWIIMRTKDDVLHDLIQKLCGNYKSDYSHTEKPLVDNMMIQRLNKKRGETLILMDGQYPFITELPDIDDYCFILPEHKESTFVTRQPKKRTKFDIRECVKEKRIQKAKKPKNTEGASTKKQPSKPMRKKEEEQKSKEAADGLDSLIEAIDRKIEMLEKEAEDRMGTMSLLELDELEEALEEIRPLLSDFLDNDDNEDPIV